MPRTSDQNRWAVYAGPPMQQAASGHDNRSGRLNDVCERYLDILSRDAPAFTVAEWSALCDALNGIWLRDAGSAGVLWAEIADADRLDGLGVKWNVDAVALATRLRGLSRGSLWSLVETVERFWAHMDLETASALAAAGARILEPSPVTP